MPSDHDPANNDSPHATGAPTARHGLSPQAWTRLISARADFLAFLRRRVGDDMLAEDILHASFERALLHGEDLRDDESVVAWFYRMLRHAIVDHARHRGVDRRATQRLADAAPLHEEPELRSAICQCMRTLLPSLKSEYAEVLTQVDLNDVSIADVAQRLQITAGNAHVRLHRARQALKQELQRCCGACATHGCLDCTCRHAPAQTASVSPSK